VQDELDLSAIVGARGALRCHPPFDPRMMTALRPCGYSRAVYSPRRLWRACEERLDLLAATARNRRDFRPISKLRRRHPKAFSAPLSQIVKLRRRTGSVNPGHVALDGTKRKANASKHNAMP
jgi:transposase